MILLGPDGQFIKKFAFATPVDEIITQILEILGAYQASPALMPCIGRDCFRILNTKCRIDERWLCDNPGMTRKTGCPVSQLIGHWVEYQTLLSSTTS